VQFPPPISQFLFQSNRGEDRYPGGSHKPVFMGSTPIAASISFSQGGVPVGGL